MPATSSSQQTAAIMVQELARTQDDDLHVRDSHRQQNQSITPSAGESMHTTVAQSTSQDPDDVLTAVQDMPVTDIYRPASACRRLDYDTCPRLTFQREHLSTMPAHKGTGMYVCIHE
jgi:hypothetical protein